MSVLPPLSLYIHIPWCLKKCPYCDFNSHAQKNTLPETGYIAALLADLRADIANYHIDRVINTIFIGGGTPSLFSPSAFEQLLTGIADLIPIASDAEITLEANPGTAESAKFSAYRRLGINRLSIGVQSFSNTLLHKLGRVHDAEQAIHAVHLAKQAGFEQINLDLMFGLPGASLDDCLVDINTALSLAPTHLSFYQLTLEPNTWFYKYPPSLPNDEAIYAMQIAAQALLAEHGFEQYEISAYSFARATMSA
ncbi:radical SAM family heme chaperone HemW [Methylocucumis oryzae]|uniref:radical SAM family heme chaperone HemW n=1 Tax=Methylocucumis oryzae TaxID=1632867 RepID=UPI000B10D577|nr:radical SAM family heme chaperone HemW [Methylocucumis oryzae]